MAQQKGKQPEVRFSKVGPNSIQGVSFLPKMFYFEKDITGAEDDDFWLAPAGVYIRQAFMRIETALDGSGLVTIGTDGNPDGFVDTTGFDTGTIGNVGTNVGSTTAFAAGVYLDAADTIRLAITGTPTVGKISGFLEYFELNAMQTRGIHFDL